MRAPLATHHSLIHEGPLSHAIFAFLSINASGMKKKKTIVIAQMAFVRLFSFTEY